MKMYHLRLTSTLLAAFLLFQGCKKDSQEEQNAQDLIIGRWQLTDGTENQYTDDVKTYTRSLSPQSGSFLEFKADGSLIPTVSFTLMNAYLLSADGKTLTLMHNTYGGARVYKIKSLTATLLVYVEELPPSTIQNKVYQTTYEFTLKK